MPDLSNLAENALLRRQQLPDAFGPETVRPSYDGLGLVNVPALAVQLLAPNLMESREFGAIAPALNPALLSQPEVTAAFEQLIGRGPVNHVVLLLLDAMGYDQIKSEMTAGALPGLQTAIQNSANFFMPITSVFPSTTTTALTSAATARTPQEHGVTGTTIYLPELGSRVNLIRFGPAVGSGSYNEKQLNPDTFVAVPNIYQRLESVGVKCEHINYYAYQNSSISRFTTANSAVKFTGYVTPATAFATLREQLSQKPADGSLKSFTYCYVSTLDTVAHYYGPLTPDYQAELAALDFSLQHEVFERLKGRSDILLCLVADHGQRLIDSQKVAWLHEHPELTRLFAAPAGGENRAVQLYIKAGQLEQARHYIDTHYGEHFLTLTKDEAIEVGLFGLPGQAVAWQATERLGDLLMLPRREWIGRQFVTADEHGPGPSGMHGGLSRAEMLIPFLATRF